MTRATLFRSGTKNILGYLLFLPHQTESQQRSREGRGTAAWGQLQVSQPQCFQKQTNKAFLNATSTEGARSLAELFHPSSITVLPGQRGLKHQAHSFNTRAPFTQCRPAGWGACQLSLIPSPRCQGRPESCLSSMNRGGGKEGRSRGKKHSKQQEASWHRY